METWVKALGLVTSKTKLQVWVPGGLGNRAGVCKSQHWPRRGDKQSHEPPRKQLKDGGCWQDRGGLGLGSGGQAEHCSRNPGAAADTRGWRTHAQHLSQSGTSGLSLELSV